jgi:hypothetical protein
MLIPYSIAVYALLVVPVFALAAFDFFFEEHQMFALCASFSIV